jgi:hypothetical protein
VAVASAAVAAVDTGAAAAVGAERLSACFASGALGASFGTEACMSRPPCIAACCLAKTLVTSGIRPAEPVTMKRLQQGKRKDGPMVPTHSCTAHLNC